MQSLTVQSLAVQAQSSTVQVHVAFRVAQARRRRRLGLPSLSLLNNDQRLCAQQLLTRAETLLNAVNHMCKFRSHICSS
ncbi:hypothetical protein EXIGLDRAFT_402878 [Exidia glandulosa HHB12029]|uniref:Uncharacterized protein n=1 Tax=Exidia glandulosa HHB12029 TaxID=1314781 RepID=A0A165BK03_EXIGL|nr:hypothetical protein EXIGLDRAFT_402878 [Exidia glandulosa HHB12029]